MRILFAGTPQVAVTSLDYLHEAGFEIAAVLTRPDAPLGRKRVLTPSPVAARAEELGLPIIKAAKITAAPRPVPSDVRTRRPMSMSPHPTSM